MAEKIIFSNEIKLAKVLIPELEHKAFARLVDLRGTLGTHRKFVATFDQIL